jgi:oxidase EvaA
VHKGAAVKYVGHFIGERPGRVLVDSAQSEHGSWFLRKTNRNMIVEALDDVEPDEDYRWVTLGQLARLLHLDNVVNMDARTVLACAPGPVEPDPEVDAWVAAERSRHELRAASVPLAGLRGWLREADAIRHESGRYFSVVGVRVEAGNREVTGWSQPLFEPHGLGVTAFATRRVAGVPQVLAHARVEAGFRDTVEVGPTVQYTPGNHPHHPPPFARTLTADGARITYEAIHSEEGGRFLNAESRYLLVEADDSWARAEPPPGFRWLTVPQLSALVARGQVNVQARTLLACLNAAAALR